MKHRIYREQQLHCDIQTAWSFFSPPENLSKITAKKLGVTVFSADNHGQIVTCMVINYMIRPILNIPLSWKTGITHGNNHGSFTGFQKKGPCKYWNHFYEYIANKEGVLIRNSVVYELPFHFLGKVAHCIFSKKEMTEIFDFRSVVLSKLFNPKKN